MTQFNSNIDENQLWQQAFPYFFPYACAEGVYIIPVTSQLMQQIMYSGGGSTKTERAISRLDLAISSLWQKIDYLFSVDFFPHRLAAATDLLRAADFGEGPDTQINALAIEVAQAVDNVERVLEMSSFHSEAVLRAAEAVEEK